jgi:sugar phosphate isomerase/epimerase
VASAGFAGLSVMPSDIWALEAQGMTAAQIAARIADAGLWVAEMDCTACWMPQHETQGSGDELSLLLRSLTAQRVVETAARVGARSVAAISLDPVPCDPAEAADCFAALCELAGQYGLKAHIEFLPVGGIRSLSEAWAIVAASGAENGGLTLDAWHFHRSGSTLEELAAIPGERIHTVQLCDAPAKAAPDLWAELMSSRLLPGEGEFDLAGLVTTLDAIGCTAPIGVEVFNTRQDTQPVGEVAKEWFAATAAVLSNTGNSL